MGLFGTLVKTASGSYQPGKEKTDRVIEGALSASQEHRRQVIEAGFARQRYDRPFTGAGDKGPSPATNISDELMSQAQRTYKSANARIKSAINSAKTPYKYKTKSQSVDFKDTESRYTDRIGGTDLNMFS
jgi:hypothetical protein